MSDWTECEWEGVSYRWKTNERMMSVGVVRVF